MVQKPEITTMKGVRQKAFRKGEFPLHLMLLPGVLLLLVFHYIPLAGLTVAFQRFIPARGLFGRQEWVGLENFRYIFSQPNIGNVFRNTMTIAFWKILLGWVVPITVALLLNELRRERVKKLVQTVIYFPHFISWVVFAGVLMDILSPSNGIVNQFLGLFGVKPVFFLGDNGYFQWTVIWTDILKNFGYGTVVYMAAITGIDPNLYEAAEIDGAGRWRQTLHVTLPGMRMIIVLMLVLSLGNVLNAGFDQILNMYNPYVYESGDIIDTLMYRLGLVSSRYGPSTAIGLFKSMVSMLFISVSYYLSWKFFDYRIF
jgi:putative aldouronate transport system permease protein